MSQAALSGSRMDHGNLRLWPCSQFQETAVATTQTLRGSHMEGSDPHMEAKGCLERLGSKFVCLCDVVQVPDFRCLFMSIGHPYETTSPHTLSNTHRVRPLALTASFSLANCLVDPQEERRFRSGHTGPKTWEHCRVLCQVWWAMKPSSAESVQTPGH